VPANRNALIRYKTIDQCLQNRRRRWTLDDLIDACSDALDEYEGLDKVVSRRTIQADIQVMRSDKLGYNAPIVVVEKKYYTYEDPAYSITRIPLTDQDLGRLAEAVEFMKQFRGFSHFQELDGMVQKLESQIYSRKTHTRPAIEFEKNENLKGLHLLEPLYQFIIQKKTVHIGYQSFRARKPETFDFFPYLLKEYRNRWFLIGRKPGQENTLNLALDRIAEATGSPLPFEPSPDFDPDTYFRHSIGVTVNHGVAPVKVVLQFTPENAPYVLTKPLHASQTSLSHTSFELVVELYLKPNFELEKEILGFGDGVKVLSPAFLRGRIHRRLADAVIGYENDLTEARLATARNQYIHKGLAVVDHVLTRTETARITQFVRKVFQPDKLPYLEVKEVLEKAPRVREWLFRGHLSRLLDHIMPGWQVQRAMLRAGRMPEGWASSWQQGEEGVTLLTVALSAVGSANGTWQVLPGSNRGQLRPDQVEKAGSRGTSTEVVLAPGSVVLLHPYTLRRYAQAVESTQWLVLDLYICQKPEGGD
jgi:predicted DNA-binding transcriptional regulator YafY